MRTAIICVVLLAVSLVAGEPPAGSTLTGVVRDQSGAAVPGAKVTLLPPGGHQAQSVVSGPGGSFEFTAIAPGTYELRVEQPGFQVFSRRVTIGSRRPAPVGVTLSLAGLRQEIKVEGGATQVSAEAGENTDVVKLDRRALDKLPVLGNDIIGAAAQFLDSSALGTGGASIVVDGMETSEKGVTASAIQEVRINQNPYSAEYARPGRSRIEVITKPGSDAYHGALNFLFRDSHLDARNAFAETRPDEQRRIFEGNLTGPLGDGKKSSFVISGQHEEEDLQSLVFAHTLSGEVRQNFPQPQRGTEMSVKVTRQLNERNTVAIRYEFTDESVRGDGVDGFNLPETAADFSNREHHIYLNYRATITKRLINEFALRGGRHDARTRSHLTGVPKIVVNDAFTGGSGQADSHVTESHGRIFRWPPDCGGTGRITLATTITRPRACRWRTRRTASGAWCCVAAPASSTTAPAREQSATPCGTTDTTCFATCWRTPAIPIRSVWERRWRTSRRASFALHRAFASRTCFNTASRPSGRCRNR